MEKKKVTKKTAKKVTKKQNHKKTKGFTLVEILVVLGLIGIIFVVAIPAINGISRSIKKRQFETKKEVLVSAAEVYAKNNSSRFVSEDGGASYTLIIPVRTLLYYGYTPADIDKNAENCDEAVGCIINPLNDQSINNSFITIRKIKSVIQADWGGTGDETYDYMVYLDSNGPIAIVETPGTKVSISQEGQAYVGCNSYGESCSVMMPQIMRDGSENGGWSLNKASHTGDVESRGTLQITESNNGKTYYAITKKDVRVTFNANGGEFESGSQSTGDCSYYNMEVGCSVISSEPSITTNKLGYEQSKDSNNKNQWCTQERCEGNIIINLASVANNITAYVKWSLKDYELTLKPNSGTYSSTPSGYTLSNAEYKRSYNIETATFNLPGGPGKSGNVFKGWTGANGTTAQKIVTIPSGSTGDRVYTAQWQQCGKGYYAEAGAEYCTACSIGAYNSSDESAVCAVCGAGKTTSGTGSDDYSDCIDCSNKAHVASWETPTWSPNEVTNLCKIKTCETGYELDNNACVSESYVVTLNPNGGTYSSAPSGYTASGTNYTRTYNVETSTFSLPGGPGKAGNIFIGWTGSNGTTAQTSVSVAKGSTGNKTYTANWSLCPANTYAAAGATSCTACPSSHPNSAAGSDSINDCYKYTTTVASNFTYTGCNYNSASAALAACDSSKTQCTAVSCSKVYYILNYDVYALYSNKNKVSTISNCTTVTRKVGTDESNHYGHEALISENNDKRCDYFSDLSTTGISASTASAFCKGSSYDKSGLTGNCSLPSNDYCNQILINIMLHTGGDEAGDCYSKCQGPTTFDGSTNTAYYPVHNVRTANNAASGIQFFIKQDNSGEGFIHRANCSGSYNTCATATQKDSKGYFYKSIKIKNCKMTKAAYDDGTSSKYRLQYKAVTQGTTPAYYPN